MYALYDTDKARNGTYALPRFYTMKKTITDKFIKEALIIFGIILIAGIIGYTGYVLFFQQTPSNTATVTVPKIEKKLRTLCIKYAEHNQIIVHDTLANAAVHEITELLISNTKIPYDVNVIIVRSRVVNAFTYPGGVIVINTGLIKETDNPEQLAAVISHELGHVVYKDVYRGIIQKFGTRMALIGLIGNKAGKKIIHAIICTHFSRHQETRADRFGVMLLAGVSINPLHYADFLEKLLDKHNTGKLDRIIQYVSTHPDTHKRIQRVTAKAKMFSGHEYQFSLDWQAVIDSL